MSRGGVHAIVPVKPLLVAKGRLSGVLAPMARRQLVLTMLDDVLHALSAAAGIVEIAVVTADGDVGDRARAHGASVVAEREAKGLNAGVAYGLEAVVRSGGRRALVLPADLPFASSSEVVSLLDSCRDDERRASVAMVPAADGDGTNALLISPPPAVTPSFGHGSFLTHLAQALARKVDVRVLHLAGIARDIDRPQDLAGLLPLPRYAFLHASLPADTMKVPP